MSADKVPHAIGSDAWIGANDYQPGSKLYIRATDFFEAVNWDKLAAVASQHRGEILCNFTDKFSIRHFNITRRLNFDDGVSWVARLRFPPSENATDREALPTSKVMEIEVATMKFFRLKTSIPVPEVHVYNFSANNEIGTPFILMDYIHGSVASELCSQKGSKYGQFGTPEQDRNFGEQMARIQAIVASIRFSKIGSLYYNKDTDDFSIGPELQTGLGPWDSSTQYYDDLAQHLLKSTTKEAIRNSQSFMLPTILNYLLRTHGEEVNGPFRLANRDFGAHNILVNENFDIVGVIDFDGVMAAPIEVVAQYPIYCCLQVEPPGNVDTRPAVMERLAKDLPKLKIYKEILAKYENEDLRDNHLKISDRLATISASAYQGMTAYQQQQDFVNDKWMKSCLHMLHSQT